ncbi:MAG TPA: cytochrome-c oxidase, cbb3-type subunit I [Myxococcota bacterium]|nr:cytochrome-c oxidase, cbb3-type subunit I [Myxococcota bacterium]
MPEPKDPAVYDMAVVRGFALSALIWGGVGMAVGLLAAAQLAWPELNWPPYLHFGRIRPVHTNAVIFGFTLGVVFAGSYYGVQRLCRVRMYSDALSRINLWGWNAIIVAAAVSLLAGHSTSKEYAELEWPLDVAIAVVWIVYGINFFATIARRRERQLYAAVWFWIATILTIGMLHVVNSLELPVSWMKSYSLYAGVNDANIQWWYGHNAVGFLLTTPILGLMYYFLPKAAGRPIYSHRLSILHFWSLIFIYIWAGPHHLIYSPLPDWAQTFGAAFSIMLILPSWGGMLNGMLTLRGAWDKVRTDPLLKMFVVGLTFYGMSTFEGPMMALRSVNSLSHFTNWTIGHVHSGALGWVGLTSFATLYYLIPRLWHTQLYSVRLAELHFWIATLGIVLYVTPMWVSGVTQGLMWRAVNPDGSLVYTFVESVAAIHVYDVIRVAGGALYIAGLFVMYVNVWQTVRQGTSAVPAVAAPTPVAAIAGGR